MVKGRDNVQPLGICHRFLKFLLNNLIGQGIKRVTLGSISRESVEVPIESPTTNANNSGFKASSKSNAEVVIEFRHVEAKENWNHVGAQDFGSSVPIPNKNGLLATDDDRTQIGVVKKEGRHFEAAPAPSGIVAVPNPRPEETGARFRGNRNGRPPTVTALKEIAVENRGNKDKDIAIHHVTIINGSDPADQETITMPHRPLKPLLVSAASNINEKADAFIRSRKEAMNKHYAGVEPDKSS